MSALVLTPEEVRVLGALIEKSTTTPQYYPMTVNAIMLAANQKSCRHPVMNLTEGAAGAALNQLEGHRLCARDDSSSRATKWRHQFHHQLLLKPPAMAVLGALMLRGPQTASELRANAVTMGGPADFEAVSAILQDLADRAQPLVVQLPRGAGQKEARYAHLLSGAPVIPDEPITARAHAERSSSGLPEVESRLEAMEARIAELERQMAELTRGPG
jgi:uncharacterized protein YceH (UPF0502 family)